MARNNRDSVPARGLAKWVFTDGINFDARLDKATFVSDTELVLDFECDGERYTVYLQRTIGNQFEGHFDRELVQHAGRATCKLYPDGANWFLFGEWSERNKSYWWAELHVSDEKP